MNKNFVLYNLREASEELLTTIKEIESDLDYDYGDFVVAMTHAYHHINTAWNARDVTEEEANADNENAFYKWREFPRSEEIYLGR